MTDGTRPLKLVVFDVDGTLAETERHGHRVAFNEAFESLGMPDRWDEDLYGDLLAIAGGKPRIFHYLTELRGWESGEAERAATELHAVKSRIVADLLAHDRIPARPGVARLLDDLASHGVTLAVATTGSRQWVERLLDRVLAETRHATFRAVVTGEDVQRLKPDPEAFTLAAKLTGADPATAIAVEDSPNGVAAAKRAGMCCLAVPGEYMNPAEVRDADLVVDGFGDGVTPIRALHDPFDVGVEGCVDPALLRRLLARSG